MYIIDTQSFFYCAQSYILAIKDILPPKYLSSSFKFCTRVNQTYLMEANTCGHLNLCRNGVITLPTRLSAHKCREVWSRITYEKKFVMPKHIQSPIFSETCEIIKLILLFKVYFIGMIYINIFFSIFRVLVVKSKLSNKILKYTILWHN